MNYEEFDMVGQRGKRDAIAYRLASHPKTCQELAKDFGVSKATIYSQLKKLVKKALLIEVKYGKQMFYGLPPKLRNGGHIITVKS